MQVEHTIDADARLVILEVIGDLGDAQLLGLASELQAIPGLKPEFSLLIDLRAANGRGVTTAGVRALAVQQLVLSPDSRRAVVVPSDLGFGMARMYETMSEPRGGGFRVFRDYALARRWVELGI